MPPHTEAVRHRLNQAFPRFLSRTTPSTSPAAAKTRIGYIALKEALPHWRRRRGDPVDGRHLFVTEKVMKWWPAPATRSKSRSPAARSRTGLYAEAMSGAVKARHSWYPRPSGRYGPLQRA